MKLQLTRVGRRSALGALLALLTCGCFAKGEVPTPAQQTADAAAAIACTRAHWGEPWDKLVADCWKQDAQAAADAIADVELLFETQSTAAGGGAAGASTLAANPYGKVAALTAAIARHRSAPKAVTP